MIRNVFGLLIAVLLFAVLFTAIDDSFLELTKEGQANPISIGDIAGGPHQRGGIFSDYIFPFELLSLLLLAALIGALYMAKKEAQ